jgi:23S rRNA pseudouridine1911/1915/1917 synthase
MILQYTVLPEHENLRLDQFLSFSTGDEISRTSIQKWIQEGFVVHTDQKILKPSYKVKEGETFLIHVPPRKKLSLEPIPMNLEILHEEEEFLVLNKPVGIACHGGPEDSRPSLVNGLLYHFKNLSKVSGETRPGIVHRLDKPTSGLMIVAKTDRAHILLSNQFQKREVEKRYYAWLIQCPKNSTGKIETNISRHPTERLKMIVSEKGRKAITSYKILKTLSSSKNRNYSLAEVYIETGRTHQIRVHFQHLGCPIVGDMLYSRSGSEFQKYGLLLFAQKLAFWHPFEKKRLEFELPFPENFLLFEKEARFH